MRRILGVTLALLAAALLVVRLGVRSEAVPPGSRGTIAFASDRSGTWDIYSLTPGTGAVASLVATSADERAPAWNPDGTKLAFVRDTPTGSCASPCWQLYVWNSVTNTTTKLSTFGAQTQLFDTTWSGDGTRIAFTRLDTVTPLQVYVVPADGSLSPRRVTGTDVTWSSPDWSPDGSTLVVSNGGKLYTIASSASLGTPTLLPLSGDVPAYAKEPTWGPDGRIAFTGGPGKFTMYALYVTNADGTGTTQLWSNGAGTLNGPAWAPDGSRIAYALVAVSGTNYEIGLLNVCTGGVTDPAPNPAFDTDPNWQPQLPAPASIPPSCASASPSPSPTTASPTVTTSSATSTTATTTSSTVTSTSSTVTTTSSTVTTTTSSTATSTPPPVPPAGTHVTIDDGGFAPTPLRIGQAATIVWDNAGTVPRGAADASGMGLWDTGLLPVGWPGWWTFTAAGRYAYADPADVAHAGAVVVRPSADPTSGGTARRFTITWASQAADAGFVYDVQVRRPGGRWRAWRQGVTRPAGTFTPDAGRGTYRFRARLVRVGVAHAGWSPACAISVR